MERYVKTLDEYLTEALNQTEWLNYKTETGLNLPDPDTDLSMVAALIQRLLNVNDPEQLIFCGDDVSIGEDYTYFIQQVIPKSEKKDEGSYNKGNYIAYYTLYENDERFFVKFDVKDMHEFSYIFIRQEDYDYFDKLDAPAVPQPQEAPEEETQPQEETPAQPAGGTQGETGGGLL